MTCTLIWPYAHSCHHLLSESVMQRQQQSRGAGNTPNVILSPIDGTTSWCLQQALVTGYVDSNRITNTFPNATVNTATSDGPGAPGGSGLGASFHLFQAVSRSFRCTCKLHCWSCIPACLPHMPHLRKLDA